MPSERQVLTDHFSQEHTTSSDHLTSIDEMSNIDEQTLMELSQCVNKTLAAKTEHR